MRFEQWFLYLLGNIDNIGYGREGIHLYCEKMRGDSRHVDFMVVDYLEGFYGLLRVSHFSNAICG